MTDNQEKGFCEIGVEVDAASDGAVKGVKIIKVGHGSPAEEKQLHAGDLLIEYRNSGNREDSWKPITQNEGVRGPYGSEIDLQIRDFTDSFREIHHVMRIGINPETLAPDDSACGVPLSDLEFLPRNPPSRPHNRLRRTG